MSKHLYCLSIILLLLFSSCNNEKNWTTLGNFKNGNYSFVDNIPNDWNNLEFDDSDWQTGTLDKKNILKNKILLYRKIFNINDLYGSKIFLVQMPRHLHFKLYLNGEFFFGHSALQIGTNNPDFWFNDSLPVFDEKSPESFFFYFSSLNFVSGRNVLSIEFSGNELNKFNLSQIAFFSTSSSQINEKNIPNTVPHSYIKRSNLPIFIINTFERTIDIDIKTPAFLKVNLPGGKKSKNLTYIGIEFRGQTSMSYPKKSFSIETRNKKGKNKKKSLLGLPKDKDWVLYGPYADKTLIRNAFIFKLSNLIGHYSPRTRFIELIINGEYQGVYLLMEKIKKGKNRVNIKQVNAKNSTKELSKDGYIISIDKGCKDGWKTSLADSNGTKHFFCYYYPKGTKMSINQKQNIQNDIRKFEEQLFYNKPVDSLVNITSFVDYFILNELARNIDAYRLSTYLYKPINGKLTMGPLWDFNFSFGYNNYLDATNPEGWVYEELPEFIPFWWKKFMQNTVFKSQLKQRWNELRKTTLSNKNLLGLIDKEVIAIGSARIRNFQRWHILDAKLWMEQEKHNSYPEYVEAMKQWTLKRTKWMDKKINKL